MLPILVRYSRFFTVAQQFIDNEVSVASHYLFCSSHLPLAELKLLASRTAAFINPRRVMNCIFCSRLSLFPGHYVIPATPFPQLLFFYNTGILFVGIEQGIGHGKIHHDRSIGIQSISGHFRQNFGHVFRQFHFDAFRAVRKIPRSNFEIGL